MCGLRIDLLNPPPKVCPICREPYFPEAKHSTDNMFWWVAFNDHARKSYPEFARWSPRMQWTYAIPLLIFISAIPVAASLFSGDLVNLVSLFLLALSLAMAATIFVIKRWGWRRFRVLWIEEHGGPIDPETVSEL
jgi:hypothetical protein